MQFCSELERKIKRYIYNSEKRPKILLTADARPAVYTRPRFLHASDEMDPVCSKHLQVEQNVIF